MVGRANAARAHAGLAIAPLSTELSGAAFGTVAAAAVRVRLVSVRDAVIANAQLTAGIEAHAACAVEPTFAALPVGALVGARFAAITIGLSAVFDVVAAAGGHAQLVATNVVFAVRARATALAGQATLTASSAVDVSFAIRLENPVEARDWWTIEAERISRKGASSGAKQR